MEVDEDPDTMRFYEEAHKKRSLKKKLLLLAIVIIMILAMASGGYMMVKNNHQADCEGDIAEMIVKYGCVTPAQCIELCTTERAKPW